MVTRCCGERMVRPPRYSHWAFFDFYSRTHAIVLSANIPRCRYRHVTNSSSWTASHHSADCRQISCKGGETSMLFRPKEEGQGLVEYALILVLVAVVVIAILTLLGPAIGNVFSTIMNNF